MQASQMIRKILLLIAAVCFGWSVQAATTLVDVADEATVDIVASGYNGYTGGTDWTPATAKTCLRFGKDVTVVLDSTAAKDGVFELFTNIYATNGNFTVEATGIDTVHWVGGVQTSGRVLVKGARRIHFGDLKTFSTGLNTRGKNGFSYFNTDVVFENGEAEGLVFTNGVTCAKTPTSCNWSIASQTRFAVDGDGLLGGGADTFTLEDYDITLMSAQGIDAGKIVVGEDCTLEVIQCSRTKFQVDKGTWNWAGSGGQHLTNDFEFAEGSTFYLFGGQGDLHLDGALSGTTTFGLSFTAGAGKGIANFNKSVQLDGTVVFRKTSAKTPTSSILKFKKNAGPYSFGDVSVEAEAENGVLTGDPSTVVSVNSVSGELDVEGIQLQIRSSAAAGAVVNLKGEGPWTVSGPEDAAAALNLVPETEGRTVNLGGKLSLGDLGSAFAVLNLLEGAELSGTSFDAATVITGKGKVVHGGSSWKDKIEFWADANSGSECFQTVRDFAPGVDPAKIPADRIIWWKDCRADKRTGDDAYGLAMTRFASSSASSIDNYPNMYPSLVENGINGKSYVKLSNGGQCRLGLTLLSATIADNFSTYQKVKPAYAIVVTRNCSSTTGSAVLSSVKGVLAASGKGYNANIFTNELVEVYRGGEKLADPTSTTWGNSIWGIYSFTTAKAQVNGLATLDKPNDSSQGGGFDYAEVMLFSEAPTELERKVIEEQLAEKWGLPCAHSGTVESVALCVVVGGAVSSVPLVEYAADDIPRAFTLNVNVPQDFKRDVRYPIVRCADTDTVVLGTVTGKSMQGLTVIREGGIAYLYAPKIGFVITVK